MRMDAKSPERDARPSTRQHASSPAWAADFRRLDEAARSAMVQTPVTNVG